MIFFQEIQKSFLWNIWNWNYIFGVGFYENCYEGIARTDKYKFNNMISHDSVWSFGNIYGCGYA